MIAVVMKFLPGVDVYFFPFFSPRVKARTEFNIRHQKPKYVRVPNKSTNI